MKKYLALLLMKLDSSFWRKRRVDSTSFCFYKKEPEWTEKLQSEKELHEKKRTQHFFQFFMDTETRYAYQYREPLIVEPEYGWLIQPQQLKLEEKSFPYYNNPFNSTVTYPSLYHYFDPLRKTTTVKDAVVITYGWNNYFHFFTETLPQWHMLDELNIDPAIPVVVPYRALQYPYVKAFFELNALGQNRNLLVQHEDEFISVLQSTIVVKDVAYSKEALVKTLEGFREASFLQNQGNRKIYLKRSGELQRSIVNADEVEKALEENGYEIVDAGKLTLEEQQQLFSSTAKLIGIHGAGMTNMIYRYGRPLSILELFPADHVPEHYKIMAKLLGFHYDKLLGEKFDSNKRFVLPVARLKEKLRFF